MYTSQPSPNDTTSPLPVLEKTASSSPPKYPTTTSQSHVPPNSTCFSWADDANQFPIVQTKQLHGLVPGNSSKDSKRAKFTQKDQENAKFPVLEYFNHADALPLPPKTPRTYPRNLSGLRSPSRNPFSSLRRRHHHSQNSYCFNQHRPQYNYFKHSYHHSDPRAPVHSPLPPFSASLDWDQDLRLSQLSLALRSLGWIPLRSSYSR